MSNLKLESAKSFIKSAENQGFARGFSSGLALRATSLLSVLASVYGA